MEETPRCRVEDEDGGPVATGLQVHSATPLQADWEIFSPCRLYLIVTHTHIERERERGPHDGYEDA
jgi:hypothetical protein